MYASYAYKTRITALLVETNVLRKGSPDLLSVKRVPWIHDVMSGKTTSATTSIDIASSLSTYIRYLPIKICPSQDVSDSDSS